MTVAMLMSNTVKRAAVFSEKCMVSTNTQVMITATSWPSNISMSRTAGCKMITVVMKFYSFCYFAGHGTVECHLSGRHLSEHVRYQTVGVLNNFDSLTHKITAHRSMYMYYMYMDHTIPYDVLEVMRHTCDKVVFQLDSTGHAQFVHAHVKLCQYMLLNVIILH